MKKKNKPFNLKDILGHTKGLHMNDLIRLRDSKKRGIIVEVFENSCKIQTEEEDPKIYDNDSFYGLVEEKFTPGTRVRVVKSDSRKDLIGIVVGADLLGTEYDVSFEGSIYKYSNKEIKIELFSQGDVVVIDNKSISRNGEMGVVIIKKGYTGLSLGTSIYKKDGTPDIGNRIACFNPHHLKLVRHTLNVGDVVFVDGDETNLATIVERDRFGVKYGVVLNKQPGIKVVAYDQIEPTNSRCSEAKMKEISEREKEIDKKYGEIEDILKKIDHYKLEECLHADTIKVLKEISKACTTTIKEIKKLYE